MAHLKRGNEAPLPSIDGNGKTPCRTVSHDAAEVMVGSGDVDAQTLTDLCQRASVVDEVRNPNDSTA